MQVIQLEPRKSRSLPNLEVIGWQIAQSVAQKMPGFEVQRSDHLEWRVYKDEIEYGGFCFDQQKVWMALYPLGEYSYLPIKNTADRVARAAWDAIGEVTR